VSCGVAVAGCGLGKKVRRLGAKGWWEGGALGFHNIYIWKSIGLDGLGLYGLCRLWAAIRDLAGDGDREVGNVPTPSSPDRVEIQPLTSPWRTNLPYFLPLMEEIPVGDIGVPLPSCHALQDNVLPCITRVATRIMSQHQEVVAICAIAMPKVWLLWRSHYCYG